MMNKFWAVFGCPGLLYKERREHLMTLSIQLIRLLNVRKQYVCSDTNCYEFETPHDQLDWGSAAETNHNIY